MTELMIKSRFSDPQHYIQYRTSTSPFPLHPNYSTSVKVGDHITTLQVILTYRPKSGHHI